MYTIEIKLAHKNGWHLPDEARRYYGRYSRDGVTVHYWNTPEAANAQKLTHDGIVNYFLNQARLGNKSVNYVLSDSKITMLVNPDNVAWCSQSGNPVSISVETDPRIGPEGYKKWGWLLNELEGRYGKGLRLFPHNYWFATACPGNLDLGRIRAEADRWKKGEHSPRPAPAPAPEPAKAVIEWVKLPERVNYVVNKDTNLWNFGATRWPDIKAIKPYSKGDKIQIYGMGINKSLNATYLVTQYSFESLTRGFNKADLDLEPRPLPTPPPEQQPTPPPITPGIPVEPTQEEKVNFIYKAMKSLLDKYGIKH